MNKLDFLDKMWMVQVVLTIMMILPSTFVFAFYGWNAGAGFFMGSALIILAGPALVIMIVVMAATLFIYVFTKDKTEN